MTTLEDMKTRLQDLVQRASFAQADPAMLRAFYEGLNHEEVLLWAVEIGRVDATDLAQRLLRLAHAFDAGPSALAPAIKQVQECFVTVRAWDESAHLALTAVLTLRILQQAQRNASHEAAALRMLNQVFGWHTLPSSLALEVSPQRWRLIERLKGRGTRLENPFFVRQVQVDTANLIAMAWELGASDAEILNAVRAIGRKVGASKECVSIAVVECETLLLEGKVVPKVEDASMTLGNAVQYKLQQGRLCAEFEFEWAAVSTILQAFPAVASEVLCQRRALPAGSETSPAPQSTKSHTRRRVTASRPKRQGAGQRSAR